MPALTQLSPADLRLAVLRFRDALRAHQDELNRLNVYPVPDGDTGTNMALTLESVSTDLGKAESMDEVCHAISRGSLMGARGNSGVITSQILRGLVDDFKTRDAIDGPTFAAALGHASEAAYQAVMRPVEGTILTVVREASEAIADANGASLAELVTRAYEAACAAVDKTPDLLPVLRDAGVVDAGGKGFTLLLASVREVVDGTPVPEPEIGATPAAVTAHLAGDDISGPRYEVMYLLDADDSTIPAFREAWGAIGDSIVVVGGEGLWNCHIHTNEIGGAVEAGIDAGRPKNIRVTDLFEQVEEERWVREAEVLADLDDAPAVTTAVVAVGVGDGVRRLLTSLGVQQVVAGGQSMNPSTAQILEAVAACVADGVIVLPNNKNIVPVAQQVPDLTSLPVAVVPTAAVVEALGALVAYDPDAPLDANQVAMAEAAARVRAGEVTQAVRDSVAECGPIATGDWIAITRGGIQAAVKSASDAAVALVDALVDDDSELLTIIVGAEADAADTARISEHVAEAHPDIEVELHHGDQPLYPYLIGVE
jgi:hypothetical protein